MNLDVYHLDCMLQHNEREHLLGIEIREGVVLEWWCSVLVCTIVTDWVPKTWVLVLEISRPITCFCYVVTYFEIPFFCWFLVKPENLISNNWSNTSTQVHSGLKVEEFAACIVIVAHHRYTYVTLNEIF